MSFFKKFLAYNLDTTSIGNLNNQVLADAQHVSCKERKALQSVGFLPFYQAEDQDHYLFNAGGKVLCLSFAFSELAIPSDVVKKLTDERMSKLSESERSNKDVISRIEEDVKISLIPTGIESFKVVDVYIDHTNDRVFVESTSQNQVDVIFKYLRKAIDSFPVSLMQCAQSGVSVVTRYMHNACVKNRLNEVVSGIGDFKPQHNIKMLYEESKATVTIKNDDIYNHQVEEYLSSAYTVQKINFSYLEKASFTLDLKTFAFSQVHYKDFVMEQRKSITEGYEEVLTSDVLLSTSIMGELTKVLNAIDEYAGD